MKRYFIFGFLTILIITLNFAFIIVLVSDDVRINYDVLFLMWVVVILAAAGLAYLEKTKKTRSWSPEYPPDNALFDEKSRTDSNDFSAARIYESKGIKKVKIDLPDEMTPKTQAGFFCGYIVTEKSADEKVQAVYTDEDQLLGYINKKKKRLCENLEQLYKEPVICWGEIRWEGAEERFVAKISVPILYNQQEVNRFRQLMKLKAELIHYESSPESLGVFSYLKMAEKFYYLQQSEITVPSLDFNIDPDILISLCKKLEKRSEWSEILRLEKFPILVNKLSKQEKKEILRTIRNAEKKLNKSTTH